MAGFQIKCPSCDPEFCILESAPAGNQDELSWRRRWKQVKLKQSCPFCGCIMLIEDDGVPLEFGGSIHGVNISPPKITLVTITGGPRTGGNAIYIEGMALDIGNLVVKFGGKPVQAITNRAPDRARVVVPIGQYTLNVVESLSGTFVVGEQLRGMDSTARGVVRSVNPLVVDGPTRAFTPGEEVHGDASGAQAKLGTPAYSGAVDVTVENEYGQRAEGGTVVAGYHYE